VDGGPYDGETIELEAARRHLRLSGIALSGWPDRLGAGSYHIVPVRPIAELRHAALAATPPAEPGPFRTSDLVEVVTLDSTIRLDIRYATHDNLFGTPVYTQGRAFLQRPAADALVRVNRALRPMGYGLLVHDGYRPWYVTKIFWDAAPPSGKIFVADPRRASRHNRGCAVDLTLYQLATGRAVDMGGLYDELSERSFPFYPAATGRQQWHRDLLRQTMEREGFRVVATEWWHFDFDGWPAYPILNVPFEQVRVRAARSTGAPSP
jgi:D-alanyl-D-alanine dipeptidase